MSYAASIGFFDGVHRGHRFLIDCLRHVAAERSQQTMVITFARHPRQVLHSSWQPKLLQTLEEKRTRLLATGIDRLEVLEFDVPMSQLSARDFMEQVLLKQLNVRTLLTGYDNRFGHGREEGFDDYVRYGHELGMEVLRAEALTVNEAFHTEETPTGIPLDDCHISSSQIRRLLDDGKVDEAAAWLGYNYELSGRVVHGEQIGRHLGFPTANMLPDDACKLIPRNGVYAVRARVGAEVYGGVTNIGTRPTFDGHRTTIETYLLDFSGDLYGAHMTIELLKRLRDERPFPGPDTLVRQMETDTTKARRLLNTLL